MQNRTESYIIITFFSLLWLSCGKSKWHTIQQASDENRTAPQSKALKDNNTLRLIDPNLVSKDSQGDAVPCQVFEDEGNSASDEAFTIDDTPDTPIPVAPAPEDAEVIISDDNNDPILTEEGEIPPYYDPYIIEETCPMDQAALP